MDTLVSSDLPQSSSNFYDLALGGAYDTVPEVCILLALFEHSDRFFPVIFDEAGM